jgi:hypothetical protein
MKRLLCSLLVATLPFGSGLADAPKSKNAKVTLVYQPSCRTRTCRVCLLYGRFGGKRTLSRQRGIPIYECTA